MERETGIVLWFNGSYGFIQRKDGEGSIFVHQTNIRMPGFRTLVDGQPVEYEVAASEKGLTAINRSSASRIKVSKGRPPRQDVAGRPS